jgi:hypothetical protein
VVVVESGDGKVLKARKGIIISAGHRSSLLLENSGIGNPEIIQVHRREGGRSAGLREGSGVARLPVFVRLTRPSTFVWCRVCLFDPISLFLSYVLCGLMVV